MTAPGAAQAALAGGGPGFLLAVVPGAVVWAVLAGALVLWLCSTGLSRRVPGITAVVSWVLGSWAGRALVLAAWAGAGWHLFCQRP